MHRGNKHGSRVSEASRLYARGVDGWRVKGEGWWGVCGGVMVWGRVTMP